MAAACAGLGDSQVKSGCESRLLVLGLALTEASCCLFVHMEKQLGWALNLGGAESVGISKAGQTVLGQVDGILDKAPVCQLCVVKA